MRLNCKKNDWSFRPLLNWSTLSFIFLTPPPFQVSLDQMYASMLIQEEQSLTSQIHPVCWNHPLIEYDQKNYSFKCLTQTCNIFFSNIKYLTYLQPMNDDFHNNSRYLGIFRDMYLRKFLYLTKYVCGRSETFSMSGWLSIISTKLFHSDI